MTTLFTVIHIVVCVSLILIVLLQAGKGADMGAAFGGSSQTVFGSSGAGTFLGKLTAAIAIIFMLTSITLTYTASRKTSNLMEGVTAPVTRQEAPAAPGPAPAAPAATPGAIPAEKAPAAK
ncbi:MAG: preprotein translocase subunit SecG [Smithellaceae bacterium]|nr:preprotein translocase subunit SecG [Syntrophaceae bacterium]MDD4242375.1 preprotein translocase subunit SecG [Smithellaceae bacterium]NLX52874.1 preprotein translocase subunit SecG [Deltaproteobacteria bacterium]